MEKTYSKIMMLSVAFMISMATFAETKINGVYYNLILIRLLILELLPFRRL